MYKPHEPIPIPGLLQWVACTHRPRDRDTNCDDRTLCLGFHLANFGQLRFSYSRSRVTAESNDLWWSRCDDSVMIQLQCDSIFTDFDVKSCKYDASRSKVNVVYGSQVCKHFVRSNGYLNIFEMSKIFLSTCYAWCNISNISYIHIYNICNIVTDRLHTHRTWNLIKFIYAYNNNSQ